MGFNTPARSFARICVIATVALSPTLLPIAAGANSDTLAKQMYRLRVCESSDRYHANTGNGYYGAYQFNRSTWRGLGYGGRPDRATKRTQDAATRKLHDRRGWSPWPSCSRKEHLH
ncbi:MAG TPA: transglycosylase family protein [Mycobacteriales bacterium]|nr:transglycosylase family protein [Mycobacteriales bacterium]